jgi:peptide chain release factor 1
MDAVREKLKALEDEYNQINEALMDPAAGKDPGRIASLSKKQARLNGAVEAWHQLQDLDERIDQADAMMKEDDPELKEMAEAEKAECEPAREKLMEHIQKLLIPHDPEDDDNAIMEIRGGAGGDEGNIFAGDLYRMYARYAESRGWKVEVMEANPSEAGGYSRIIFSIKGKDGVYGWLKFESGVHRVQRVPKTESQGRIQTSTATVYCYPQVEKGEFEIDPNDLEIETHRSSGAGGQHINKTDSAVRIVHKPTGITVNCQEGRSQIENRETAMAIIRARVYAYQREQEEAKAGAARRSAIGSGDRSEKIRTYNYPQNRVTDHRIGLTLVQLDRIMEGKLDDLLNGLRQAEEKQKLEEAKA